MTENKENLLKSTMTSGAFLGLILIIFSLLMYFLDLSTNKWVSYFSYVIFLVCIPYFQIQYRNKECNGYITYGKAFGYAVLTVLFASIIAAIFSYIQLKVIDPGLVDKILGMQEEKMTAKGISADQMEMTLNMTRKMMSSPFFAVIALIVMMFWGTLISLITSIFVKKEGDPFKQDMQGVGENKA